MKISHLVMPSHIVVKDGLSCGDRVVFMYDFVESSMLFSFVAEESCSSCKESCEFLENEFSGKNVKEILLGCDRYESVIKNDCQMSKYYDCYIGPVKILKECALGANQNIGACNTKVDLYVDKMDCDACATRENVSWLYQKPKHIHGNYSISDSVRKRLMQLGKLECDTSKLEDIKSMIASLGNNEFEFIEEYKLMPMVYQNLKKTGVFDLSDDRWRLLFYQRQRTIMACPEIYKVDKYIKDNKFKAYWIKGAFTRSLYQDPLMRNLTDYDMLVLDEKDAFVIINKLLNDGFSIFPDSFSLKKSFQNGKNVYTGHLHFQKILSLQYRLIVDINFTGFPMVRIASYVPLVHNNHIAMESMIVIALCHLFKHKEVFIKDINDIYIMLSREDYNVDILREELEKNELEDFFSFVLKFIVSEYSIKNDEQSNIYKLNMLYSKKMECLNLRNWPYDIADVENIKEQYFAKYARCRVDTQRLYLYPVLVTKNLINSRHLVEVLRKKMAQLKYSGLTDGIYHVQIKNFFFEITPIGVFLEMKEYYKEEMKQDIRKIVNNIQKVAKLECIDIPYAIAFEEKWLDNMR